MDATEPTRCLNCATELRGRYCHACGQKSKSSLFRVVDVVGETLAELVSVDGKLLSTLRLLFVPGALTRAYIDGRRVRYAAPIRVYLFSAILLFAALSFSPARLTGALGSKGTRAAAPAATPASTAQIERQPPYAPRTEAERAANRRAIEMVGESKGAILFATPPLFALALMAAYWRSQRYYVAHLCLALHLQAFLCTALALMAIAARPLRWLLSALGPDVRPWDSSLKAQALLIALLTVAAVYLAIAARRVYRVSWLSAILKAPPLVIVYLVSGIALFVAAVAITRRITG